MRPGISCIIQDADLEYDPKDYPSLLEPIQTGLADVVYGTRFAGGGAHRVLFFWHSMGNRMLTLLSNMLTNLNLSDMEVGYKVFRAEALKGIELKSQALRLRAGDHGEAREERLPLLRSADFLPRPNLRGREKNHLERRPRGIVLHDPFSLRGLTAAALYTPMPRRA